MHDPKQSARVAEVGEEQQGTVEILGECDVILKRVGNEPGAQRAAPLDFFGDVAIAIRYGSIRS
ncbi:MAG: hypothetical protein IT335_08435 [Thermomicrobiales bacterium]|jgi:hypothetical protein|nr:hypothetical protein [Thermomicrobiales bacterium]